MGWRQGLWSADIVITEMSLRKKGTKARKGGEGLRVGERASGYRKSGERESDGVAVTHSSSYPSFSPTFAVWLFPLNCSSMAALPAM